MSGVETVKYSQHGRQYKAAGVMAGGAAGAVAGLYSTTHFPVHADLAPGDSVSASLRPDMSGLEVSSSLGGIDQRDVKINPVPGIKGAKIFFQQLDLGIKTGDPSGLAAIAVQPESSLTQPIQHAVEVRVAEGAGAGLVLAVSSLLLAANLKRHVSASEKFSRNFKRTIATLAAFVIGATAVHTTHEMSQDNRPSGSVVPEYISNRLGLSKGATITGPNQVGIQKLLSEITAYIETGRKFWQTAGHNYLAAFNNLPDSDLAEINTPTKKPSKKVLVMTGAHCNLAFTEIFLPKIMATLQPDIVAITGDIYSAGKTTAIENSCLSDLETQLKGTPVVKVAGDHDPKNMPDSLGLKSKFLRVVDGINFLGIPEPTTSTYGPSQPAELEKRHSLIGKAGSKIADAACKTTQTGKNAFVVLQRKEEGLETLARGCAPVLVSDHGFDNQQLPTFTEVKSANGTKIGYQQVVVTSSGADGGINQYAPAKRPASLVLMSIDPESGLPVNNPIQVIIQPDGTVRINREKPATRTLTKSDYQFLKDFSQNSKDIQLAQRAHSHKIN